MRGTRAVSEGSNETPSREAPTRRRHPSPPRTTACQDDGRTPGTEPTRALHASEAAAPPRRVLTRVRPGAAERVAPHRAVSRRPRPPIRAREIGGTFPPTRRRKHPRDLEPDQPPAPTPTG